MTLNDLMNRKELLSNYLIMTQPQEQQQNIELRMIDNPRELIRDVGDWAESQPWHPKHAPDLGVVEEIGELFHGVLKHHQGIRGFDNTDKYRAHTLDALGDIMVYLSHWCYLNGAHYHALIAVEVPTSMELRDLLKTLVIDASKMLHFSGRSVDTSVASTVASGITQTCQYIARMFGWDLFNDCLYPTWHRVRMRNFNKDKQGGGREAIEAAHGLPDIAPKLDHEAVPVNVEQIEGERPLEGMVPLEKKQ